MKNLFKKLVKWLQEWEGIWMIPLLFILFLNVTGGMLVLWGDEAGYFPPGLINKVFLGSFTFFVGLTVVNLTINLYHRGLYHYFYKKDKKDLTDITQPSVKADFKSLPSWLRFLIVPLLQLLLLVIFFCVVVTIV